MKLKEFIEDVVVAVTTMIVFIALLFIFPL